MRWVVMLALMMGACQEVESPLDPEPRQAEGADRRCVLSGVETLDDLSATPEGHSRSPAEVLKGATGDFLGAVAVGEVEVEGALHVDDRVGEVRLVTARWSDTSAVCDTWYEVELSAVLTAGGGLLDEVFSAMLQAGPDQDMRFALTIPQEQLRGSLGPEVATSVPAWLEVDARFEDGWTGELVWWVEQGEEAEDVLTGGFWFAP